MTTEFKPEYWSSTLLLKTIQELIAEIKHLEYTKTTTTNFGNNHKHIVIGRKQHELKNQILMLKAYLYVCYTSGGGGGSCSGRRSIKRAFIK
jgi:hypothetical protein